MARDSRVGVSYQHRQESTTMSPQIFILVNCEIEDKKKFQGKMHLKAECRRRRLEIFLWAALFEDESASKAFNGLITILKIKHEVEAPKWLITDEEFPKTEKNVNFVWKQTLSGELALSDVSAGLLVDFLDASVCTIKFLLRRTLPPVGDNSATELISFVLIRGEVQVTPLPKVQMQTQAR